MFLGDVAAQVCDEWDALDSGDAPPPGSGRRVKDVRSIWVRNLTSLVDPEHTTPRNVVYSLYVEGDDGDARLVHCSEIVRDTLNPSFLPIEPRSLKKHVSWECSVMLVQVWAIPPQSDQMGEAVIQLTVDLNALVRVPSNETDFGPNALVVELWDGQYAFPDSLMRSDNSETPRRNTLLSEARDAAPISVPYESAMLFMEKCLQWRKRMDEVEQATSQVKQQLRERVTKLNRATKQAQMRRRHTKQIEDLRQRLAEEQALVREESEALRVLQEALPPHAAAIEEAPKVLAEKKIILAAQSEEQLENHQQLLRHVSSTYKERCWQLVAALFAVFPIRATKDPSVFQIHGITLHNTNNFSGCDEESIATGLGYVCHLLYHLAKLLGICLKHPLRPGLSNSRICDEHSKQQQLFNLWFKGSGERLKFDYGVFLMNKDIEQVLRHEGIKGGEVKDTLPNLHALERQSRCLMTPERGADAEASNHPNPPVFL